MWSPTKSLAVALVLMLSCGFALAADAESTARLRSSLEDHFVLLPLSDGLLLQPLVPGAGPRTVEISDSAVALDGQRVGTDELRLRLGEEAAELVLAAADLDDEDLQGLLSVEALPEVQIEAAPEVPDEEFDTDESAEDSAADDAFADRSEARREVAEARAEKAAERARRAAKHKYRRTGDSEFAVGGSVIVDTDEVTEDVLVIGGFLKVEGRVVGDATVMGGSATIEGEVTGDVVAIGGPVRLEDGSNVHGNVTSVGGRVFRDEGARVGGEIEQRPMSANFDFARWSDWRRWDRSNDFHFSPWHWWSGLGWSLVRLLFVAGLAWLALLVAPGPIDRMERRIADEPWKTGLVGLLAQVLFFPVLILVTVFLAISIIGIPLLLVLPFALLALMIASGLGFVAVAGRVGSWARERFGWEIASPYWIVLVGLGLIGGLSIIGDVLDFGVAPMRFMAGMFMFFGAIVSWAACTIGFGAVVLTRFGTADSWNRAEDLVAPLPPVPGFVETFEGESEEFADEDSAHGAVDDAPDEPEEAPEESPESPRDEE